MRSLTIALCMALLLCTVNAEAAKFAKAPKNGVVDEYIVVIAEGAVRKPGRPESSLPRAAQLAQLLGVLHGGQVSEVWEDALQGFVIRMSEAKARKLAEDPRIASVEQNFWISSPVGDCYYGTAWQDTRTLPSPTSSPQSLTCTDPDPLNDTGGSTTAPACKDNWGIDRIDQTNWARNNSYSFVNNGSNVHVYVMDTGIQWSHRELKNAAGVTRVSGGVDARSNPVVAGNSTNTDDCYGHGTHVAGIIGGRTYGVAKNALLHPVRTIGCATDPLSNAEFIDRTIRGLNWIAGEVTSKRATFGTWPSVVSWSGGNGTAFVQNTALRTAVANVVDNDVTLVQAAGNQSGDYNPSNPALLKDACLWSFGGDVPKVIVAAGMDHNDGRWTRRPTLDADDARYCGSDCGSNAGSCVDIWAPSAHVISSNMNGDDWACRLSGTSMAAPHVAGVVAVYLQSNPSATPTQVANALRSRATWNALQSSASSANYIGRDSDNALLFSDTRSTGDTAPVASFTATCPGRQCNLNATASTDDVSIASHTWRFGDGTTGTGSTLQHTFPANFSGEIVLKVTDGTGKTDHLLKSVSVNADAPPVASFTFSCTGLSCSFNSSGSTDDQSIASRAWTFGDSSSGTGTSPSHTYPTSGAFVVELTVTDNAGQTAKQSQTIGADLKTPANVLATASGATVTISWSTSLNADGYTVERKTSSAGWSVAQTVSGGSSSSVADTPSSTSGVVLYRVFARYATLLSASSNNDVAFVGTFSNDPLVTPAPVRAEDLTELRSAVNGLLAIGGQAAAYTTPDLDPNNLRGQGYDDNHFVTLMQNLNTARTASGLPSLSFGTLPAAPNGVYGNQIVDLRNGLK